MTEDEPTQEVVPISPEKPSQPAGSFSPDFVNDNSINGNPEEPNSPSKSTTPFPTKSSPNQPVIKPSGTNVGMFTTDNTTKSGNSQSHFSTTLSKPPSIVQQNESKNSVRVPSINKNTITFRFKLKIFNNSCNCL